MSLIGWRGVTHTRERGTFFCPRCADQQSYERKRTQRFIQFCAIPLIPPGLLQEYDECINRRATH